MTHKPVDMLIAGAQKAATSSLLRYLGQHPQLCTHEVNEITYFVNEAEYNRGYIASYPSYFSACDTGKKLLGKSAGVMYLPNAVERLQEHNPDLQIVFVLRHPVDRAYSAYWFARQLGWEPIDDFETAVWAGVDRFQGDWVKQRNCMYLERGEYFRYLSPFFAHFKPEQLHVILVEDLKGDANQVCHKLFRAAGVQTDFVPDLTRQHNQQASARHQGLATLISSQSDWKRLARTVLPDSSIRLLKNGLRQLNKKIIFPSPHVPIYTKTT